MHRCSSVTPSSLAARRQLSMNSLDSRFPAPTSTTGETMVLASNPDCTLESDLSLISEKQLRTLYPDELGGEHVHFLTGPDSLAEATSAESKSEFWMPLVVFAVALMLLETFCAWKFAHHIK